MKTKWKNRFHPPLLVTILMALLFAFCHLVQISISPEYKSSIVFMYVVAVVPLGLYLGFLIVYTIILALRNLSIDRAKVPLIKAIKNVEMYSDRVSLIISIIINIVFYVMFFTQVKDSISSWFISIYFLLLIFLRIYLLMKMDNYMLTKDKTSILKSVKFLSWVCMIMPLFFTFYVLGYISNDFDNSKPIFLIVILILYIIFTVVRLILIFRKRKQTFIISKHSLALLDYLCILSSIIATYNSLCNYLSGKIESNSIMSWFWIQIVVLWLIGTIFIYIEAIRTIIASKKEIKVLSNSTDNEQKEKA